MKKLFITLIFLSFSMPLFAQQLWWVDTTSTGNPGKKIYLGEWIGTKSNLNYSPLPIKGIGAFAISSVGIDSIAARISRMLTNQGVITTFPNSQTYADIRNSWDWTRSFTTYSDSVRTDSATVVRSRDTITIGGTEWAKVTIRGVSSTDSLYFGVGTTAPSVWTKVIGTTPFITEKLNHTYFTKLFIKGYGANDSIKSYEVTIEAF